MKKSGQSKTRAVIFFFAKVDAAGGGATATIAFAGAAVVFGAGLGVGAGLGCGLGAGLGAGVAVALGAVVGGLVAGGVDLAGVGDDDVTGGSGV